jgi:carbon-monoxide dehydrogenase medium subunit
MHNFKFTAPTDLREAVGLKALHKSTASFLAGGTDLLVFMRAGRKRPEWVIDVKKIPELNEMTVSEQGLTLGAGVSCLEICRHPQIARHYPAMVDCASLIGGIQVQGRATVGGNLCNAAPSADIVPTLIALNAIAHVASERGRRQIPVAEFCTAPGRTVLENDEILVSVNVPAPTANAGARFLRFIPRNEMDIAEANAAAWVQLDEAHERFKFVRIAVGAVAPRPLYVAEAGAALEGMTINDDNIRLAGQIARAASSPIEDMRGTVEHRLQLVEVLTQRALKGAIARARGETI